MFTRQVRGDKVLLLVQISYSGFGCFLHNYLKVRKKKERKKKKEKKKKQVYNMFLLQRLQYGVRFIVSEKGSESVPNCQSSEARHIKPRRSV